ncbi:unnamed protein product [Gongylonema pulchrum]|uniref:Protein kinase domain-containing protein n=1 Tax=Gongylonema pulchrum TaxID=637853 RepID=A0A183EJV5_9BILA|nr:unnamed protein product [Gongylonema pulchrum]
MKRDTSSEDVLANYEHIQKIGEGTHGAVYKFLDKRAGKFVAMEKVLTLDDDEGIPAAVIREIGLLRNLVHPDIKALGEVALEAYHSYLVFEYLPTNLKDYIRSLPDGQLIERDVQKQYTYQILRATCFCHRFGALHCNLKPENILLDGNGALKSADFGLAQRVDGVMIKMCTHELKAHTRELWYLAPELLLGSVRYSLGADIWSIGCIFAELATRKPLFQGRSRAEQL